MTSINRTHYAICGICVICGLMLALGTARAQVATGTPPLGSFGGGPDQASSADPVAQTAVVAVCGFSFGIIFHNLNVGIIRI